MLAAALAWEAVLDGTDRERAVALARFALDRDRLWEVDDGLFWIVAAVVRMLADDDLGDFWARARAQAHRRGSLFAVMSTSLWAGFWHRRRGEIDDALGLVAAALDQIHMWGGDSGVGEPHIRAVEIGCHLDRGDLGAARQAADAGLAGPRVGDAGRVLHLEIARVLVAEERHAEVLAWLDTTQAPVPIANPVHNPWRGIRAAALHGLGRTPEAVELVAEEVALLRRWGAPTYLGPALRLQGELLDSAGVDRLREAVAVLTPTGAAVELARARCALGSSPAVPDAEAVPLLQAAGEAAEAAGAMGVRDDARAALRRRGAPTGNPGGHVRRLSDTERRILDLAAAGLAVHEVAQQMFLTPGTVRAVLESSPEPSR